MASFSDENQATQTISQQIQQQVTRISRAKRYLAYFQAYTSTYAEVHLLKQLYEEALQQADIIGLCVGTRPDCVPESVLSLLSHYRQQGYEIWLELGLQTAHDKTLHRINRGHGFEAYQQTTQKARALGLKVCTHLICGLPGEDAAMNMQTLERVLECGTDGIKLHPLHIVEGSVMAKSWRAGRLQTISLDEYTHIAGEMIRHTPDDIVYHRISASARKPTLLAPEWCENRWVGMNSLYQYLLNHGKQGSAL